MNPGFHVMPAERYHQDPCVSPSLSSSIAQVLLRESPRKAWHQHPRLNPDYRENQDPKFDIGKSSHSVLLENDASKIVVVDPADYPGKKGGIPDGWTNDAIRAARDTARAEGKTPLLKHHYDDVRRMVDAALAFIPKSEVAEYWSESDPELTGIWQEGPIWLRCRFDKITKNRRVILDYKSTTDASPNAFGRQIHRMGYHIQDALYRRCARFLGSPNPEFVFVAQSVEPPHECSLVGCDPALREIAEAEVDAAIGIWRQCVTKKEWPSYGGRIHWTLPTSWQMKDHEQRIMEAA